MQLKKVILHTHRLSELRHFYANVFELPVRDTATGFCFETGHTTTHFVPAAEGTKPFYHFAFNIPNNLFQQAHRWMEKRSPLLRHEGETAMYFDRYQAHAVYCYDPAGNIVEFIARERLNNAVDADFSSEHILEMSEIGLPVPNVADYAAHICQQTGVQVWELSSLNDSLTFVGHDEGVLIVVREGRIWLMTDKEALPFPADITIKGAGKPFHDAERGYHLRFEP